MRVAFFGLPLAALLLAKDGHDVPFAAVSRMDAVGLRRLVRRLGRERVVGIGELSPAELRARVAAARPDLVVSWFWTKRLPMDLVRLAPHGGIGVHPSLLPRHRGPDPYFAAIDAGDDETGVTAHRLEAEYDTGAILGQKRLRIDPAWNAWQLARALDRPSLALLRETVARFARGDAPAELPQDERLATAADAPDDDACEIRWTWPTERILRRIRALAPAPGAFTEIGDEIVTLHRARAASAYPRVLAPGEAALVGDAAVVRTADGAVELLAGEVEGRPADAAELAALVARARAIP